jgi:glycosyltransferase involved in cell wall biosynthesis
MSEIVLSYIGVHQMFQMALAAEELGKLEALRCSLVDRPGKWGQILATKLRIPSASPLGYDQIPPEKLVEHPWPLVMHRLLQKAWPSRPSEHLRSNEWFDRSAARWLQSSRARVFVGTETCALYSMRMAKSKGMTCVLDCAGIPNSFLDHIAHEAATELGLKMSASSNSPAMVIRKEEELRLADVILCASEFQAEQLIASGAESGKVKVIPLWVDAGYWAGARDRAPSPEDTPLKVIYAGAVSLKKGVPYLLDAMRQLGEHAKLTLVGKVSPELQAVMNTLPENCTHLDYVAKEELRRLYAAHDVLVMPSLGDSFGFVTMEAMASGLPVIVSRHAGAPVPDGSWRIPARNSAALVSRLQHYHDHRAALVQDSQLASSFAAQLTPERYRQKIKALLGFLLS